LPLKRNAVIRTESDGCIMLLALRWRWVPLLGALVLSACGQPPLRISGAAQGTTYHITALPGRTAMTEARLQSAVTQRLAEIDRALSNYRDDSELNRLNRAAVGQWLDVGADLYAVLKLSARISAETDGAFDVTVAPLVQLWGFGPGVRRERVPDAAAIAAARAQVDYRQLRIDPQRPRVQKLRPLSIDVNGIAQGYSVDCLAELLARAGLHDYLVEVGGELRLAGRNPRGALWRIGIEKPGAGFATAQQAIVGTDIGITTAGDYRDYFERGGVRYSHTIDPATGRPIAHKLASVTVVAPNAALADGYDTALEVLGPERGLALAQRLHLAAYFIVRGDAGFRVFHTPALQPYLPDR
jgi:thiamine biosynthesis lipoprotein